MYGMVYYGIVCFIMVWNGLSWCSMFYYGIACHIMVGYRMVIYGMFYHIQRLFVVVWDWYLI